MRYNLEFPDVQVSGTQFEGAPNNLKIRQSKVLTLSKKYANVWEYDAIQIGIRISTGQTVFIATDKWFEDQFGHDVTVTTIPFEQNQKAYYGRGRSASGAVKRPTLLCTRAENDTR